MLKISRDFRKLDFYGIFTKNTCSYLILYKMGSFTNVKPSDLNYDYYETLKYDNDIKNSIPGHKDLHSTIEKVINRHGVKNIDRILELGIGTGLTSERVLRLNPEASLTAIDFSEQMINGAQKRLSEYNVKYLRGDYSEINFDDNLDMVISVIGIHHQTDEGKKILFEKIYKSLADNGIFVFGDLVTYKNKIKAALNDALHYHHLVENACDKKTLGEWAHHHKFLNLLAPIEDQIQWLKDVGFSDVGIEYEKMNTALIVAKK